MLLIGGPGDGKSVEMEGRTTYHYHMAMHDGRGYTTIDYEPRTFAFKEDGVGLRVRVWVAEDGSAGTDREIMRRAIEHARAVVGRIGGNGK